MNSNWLKRVEGNIFPVSFEQNDVRRALNEWVYQGNMYDVEDADETCELCDQPHIRYQFEIFNIINANTLQIGSECIKRFKIGVMDNRGHILSNELARKKVNKDRNKLITDAKIKSVINSLINLARIDDSFEIESFIKFFKDNKTFTPKQLTILIWRLDKYKVEHNKSHFKMTIKKNKDKEQLLQMEEWKVQKIWGCLSKTQKEYYKDNK
ncbi:hypothetical protein GC101_03715 [Paenibacillus sp. LMG 31459]|uniref:Uncharacterized protein n=1 Tax=Paenibacillus phytohabitans TaxID=2654978 RepID=A0ABX1YAP0_9BACL|nr:hypothetical protein [Paenibacillus phytohabitans]NOU77982.1 hypothetical protein [Paenibacillus phytohabitans]